MCGTGTHQICTYSAVVATNANAAGRERAYRVTQIAMTGPRKITNMWIGRMNT